MNNLQDYVCKFLEKELIFSWFQGLGKVPLIYFFGSALKAIESSINFEKKKLGPLEFLAPLPSHLNEYAGIRLELEKIHWIQTRSRIHTVKSLITTFIFSYTYFVIKCIFKFLCIIICNFYFRTFCMTRTNVLILSRLLCIRWADYIGKNMINGDILNCWEEKNL